MSIKQFSSENLLLSVVGHLFLIALMVTSFFIVIERAKLVAPDRVQITEIDLSQVTVTGTETELYNTEAPKPEEIAKVDFPEKKIKPQPEPEDIGDDKSINAPALVDAPEKKADASKKNKTPDKPLPKSKMVVRVNRETASLNRTMTVSVVDALRVAMTRCWVVDNTRSDIADIRAVAHLTMNKTGMVRDVWFESEARGETDPAFAYVLGTIRSALTACQPFKMLPVSEFANWEKIQLTFYPTQGTIM